MLRVASLFPLFVALLLAHGQAADDAIVPSPRLPNPLPWNLDELSKPPAFEWEDKDSPIRSLLYANENYGGKPTRVFAYYATPGTIAKDPSLDKNLPAVVLVHGGGGTAFAEWVELWAKRGYAAISMDLSGRRPYRDRLPDGGPEQNNPEKFEAIDQPYTEQWPFHSVAAIIRAHSLIRSFPEVDRERTAITGISWGGYLTCMVVGVDNRFKAAVPVYGCGFLHDNAVWDNCFNKLTPQQCQKWTSLWDPAQYLPAANMPILFMNGTNDFAYPLDIYTKSYALVRGEKQMCVTVNMPHSHPAGWAPKEIGLFIDQHLLAQPALPAIDEIVTKGGVVTGEVKNDVKLSKAELHFTTDAGPVNRRQWTTVAAKIDGRTISAEGLPKEATAWLLTVRDDRDAVVSSPVELATQ